jgi:lipopolysaccharide/colanic/teichoic acid biosynthesis glycosyltransferase
MNGKLEPTGNAQGPEAWPWAQAATSPAGTHPTTLHGECEFHALLGMERKRCERSRLHLILMLLDLSAMGTADALAPHHPALTAAIAASVREIDCFGWHQNGQVLGVVYAEIEPDQLSAAIFALQRKVSGNLRRHLAPELAEQIAITLHVFPERHDGRTGDEPFDPVFYPDTRADSVPRRLSEGAKSVMDFTGSLLGLVLLSPLLLAIAALIRLTSPGPVLFRQERIGQMGKRFVFLKFRSMYVNNDDAIHREFIRKLISGTVGDAAAPDGAGSVYKITHDPRITPLGRFLRKTSLDELPQLINVLKGEMSLVGPRPPIPYELADYDMWHRHRLLERKPGITGLWQVTARSSTTFDGMVRLDIHYIRHWSLWLDLKILMLTPLAVIKGRGAY